MCFKKCAQDSILKGSLLAMLENLFPDGIPTLKDFAQETEISVSTFKRCAPWLLDRIPKLLEERRPGPRPAQETGRDEREEALRKLEDLRAWIRENCSPTEKNTCYSGEAKLRITTLSEEIQESGALSFDEIAKVLCIDKRHLLRIRKKVKAAGGAAPQPKSRKPHHTEELAEEIQRLIRKIQISSKDYRPTDVKRILEKNYKAKLKKYHGSETISLTTTSKYMSQGKGGKKAKEREHPRGAYHYPEPFQQAAIDTSYFKIFGFTFYFITVFEVGGRMNLLTRIFLRESTAAVVEVIEQCLSQYSGIEAFVIDRGTPYLNEEVKRLLEKNGKMRIVCPPETPTAKACCERHFRPLKAAIRTAIEKIFAIDPGWPADHLAKLLEMGVAVFQQMYHQIPQQGIDGKSPAERIESFNPVRACSSMINLFERALNNEPVEEYIHQLHQQFQLPNSKEETVEELKRFGTAVLREVAERVAPYMGPPYPEWMYNPLGFLAAKAREVWEQKDRSYYLNRFVRQEVIQWRQDQKEDRGRLESENSERQEHPEQFLEPTFELLLNGVKARIPGLVTIAMGKLKDLLRCLSKKLGYAFAHELGLLRTKILQLQENEKTKERLYNLVKEAVGELQREGAAC